VQWFIKQEQPCIESLKRTLSICDEVEMDRKKHTQAIENAWNKKFYDNESEYQTYVLDSQGRDELENYIMNAKKKIFGSNNVEHIKEQQLTKLTKHAHLEVLINQWEESFNAIYDYDVQLMDSLSSGSNWLERPVTYLKSLRLLSREFVKKNGKMPRTTTFVLANMALLQEWPILNIIADPLLDLHTQQNQVKQLERQLMAKSERKPLFYHTQHGWITYLASRIATS